jgi:hypothetical protein
MSPEVKFHSFVTSLTTLVVFSLWVYLQTLIDKYPIISIIIASIFTIGMYRLINTILMTIFRNSKILKKFILGPAYMEGTWVGFFVGHNNIRYLVETFEQDLSLLKIRGRVYREDFTFHGSHISTNASLDIVSGHLSYSYDADTIPNTHINAGLARFTLDRDGREQAPYRIIGYSSDLFNPTKLQAFQEKYSDSTAVELSVALDEAEKVHIKYRNTSGE